MRKSRIVLFGVTFLRFILTADKLDPVKSYELKRQLIQETYLLVDAGYHFGDMYCHFLGISLYPTFPYSMSYPVFKRELKKYLRRVGLISTPVGKMCGIMWIMLVLFFFMPNVVVLLPLFWLIWLETWNRTFISAEISLV